MTLSNEIAHDTLTRIFRTEDCWLSLHTADPLHGGLNTAELVGGGYARQRVGWSVPANRTITNTGDVMFQQLPVATIGWLGVYDAGVGGTLLAVLTAEPQFVSSAANTTVYIPTSTLAIELL